MTGKGKTQSDYVTTTELAELCGVSRYSIINWIKQGKINCVTTIGRHRRIHVSAVSALIETFRVRDRQSSQPLSGSVQEVSVECKCKPEETVDGKLEQPPARPSGEAAGSLDAFENKREFLESVSCDVGRGLRGLKEGMANLKRRLRWSKENHGKVLLQERS